MLFDRANYDRIQAELLPYNAKLVAVSKTKSVEAIRELYDYGQRTFGENYVAELNSKQALLPAAIDWHFIGHLQSNKIKLLSPAVTLIHGIDSLKIHE